MSSPLERGHSSVVKRNIHEVLGSVLAPQTRPNHEPSIPSRPAPYQAPGWHRHLLIQINFVSLHSGFISSLVWVPSVNGKFFDSGSCSSSCLCPSAGLKLEKTQKKKKEKHLKMQGTSFHLAGMINVLLGEARCYASHGSGHRDTELSKTKPCFQGTYFKVTARQKRV